MRHPVMAFWALLLIGGGAAAQTSPSDGQVEQNLVIEIRQLRIDLQNAAGDHPARADCYVPAPVTSGRAGPRYAASGSGARYVQPSRGATKDVHGAD